MATTDTEIKFIIERAIKAFSSGNLTENSLKLFQELGYNTNRQQPLPEKTFACFKEYYIDANSRFNEEKAITKEWQQIDLLFQLTKEEVSVQNSLFDTAQVDRTIIEAYLFFCIELNDREYTRTALSQITREINKVFKMPLMVLFKLGDKLSLAVINRRLHKKDAEKDVLEKVTLIKDIDILKPHRAHIEILFDLSIEELRRVRKFTNFVELHEAWKKTLDTKELNKRFYKDLSNWYFWAIKEVYFPGAPFQATLGANAITDPDVREHNAKNLIRLLTRLLFVWFIKEKSLVPDELFDEKYIKAKLLTGFDPAKTSTFDDHTKASRYYRAVLQNLFFASLNQVVGKREFRKQGQHMNVTNLMRYESYFKDPQAFVALIDNVVPFMNGGLFECLDKPDPQKKGKQGGDVIIYEDGFSDRADNTLCVPDYIFFSNSEHADLSSELDDKKQSNVTVRGLINILNEYKFTVTENTPIEEDIALDPELLGRVFENLLASYNPETKTTARKQTGSFYTPREIVDYMVDESLKAYLKQKLVAVSGMKEEDADVGLNILFSYTEKEHAFNDGEKQVLIEAIDTCKVLDPACGSGAFPMGILHKLVYVLHKLDPDNELWRERQRQNAIKETEDAFRIGNKEERENRLKDISEVFENNAGDFGRKLYLIENCIYGVDIQQIATQISKLRFFISLVVDQQSNTDRAHNYGVIPLPNLETKFVAANSLIGLKKPEHQINCFDNQSVKNIAEQIQEVRHKLFSAKTPETKRKLKEKDDALRKQLRDLLISNGLGNDTAHQLAAWDPYDQNAKSPFFDMEWMFGIEDGFDVVIGNPPYVQIQSFSGQPVQKEWERQKYETFAKTGDLYCLFYEKGYRLLRNHGVLAFITSNKWMRAAYGEKLRRFFSQKTQPRTLIDFSSFQVFDSATVDTNVLLFTREQRSRPVLACQINSTFTSSTPLEAFVEKHCINLNDLTGESWVISDQASNEIRKRIEAAGTPLKAWDIVINYGIKTGFNEAFIIDGKKRAELIAEEPKSAEIIKPVLRGRDIKRYRIDYADLWLINTHNGYGNVPPVNMEEYPAIKAHLDQYWNELKSRQDNGITPYNLRNCAYLEEFEKEKIVWGNLALSCQFALAEAGLYINAPSPLIGGGDRYLLAVLNTSVADYYIRSLGVTRSGGYFEYKPMFVEKLPVPQIDDDAKKPFKILADYVLLATAKEKKIQRAFFEQLIDGLVYELYFPDELRGTGKGIHPHIGSLMQFADDMSEEQKLAIIQQEFDRLYDPCHPVRNNIETLDSVDVVRSIRKALKR